MSRRLLRDCATLEELTVACEELLAATPYDQCKAAGPCCTIQVPLEVGLRLHRVIGRHWRTPTEAGDVVGHCRGVRIEVAPESRQLALFGAPA